MSNWETFQDAYKMASPEIKAFVDSGTIGNFVKDMVSTSVVPEKFSPSLIILISDISLSITKIEELNQELIKLIQNENVVNTLISEITSFLIRNKILEETGLPITKPTDHTNIFYSSTNDINVSSEIEQTEKMLSAIAQATPGLRTMAADMQAAQAEPPTYVSNQSDILSNTPPARPPEGPRWETDA